MSHLGLWLRDDGTKRETTGESASSQNQLDKKNRGSKRRMDELRVEVGVKECFKKKLVRCRLKWTKHVERMGGGIGKETRCPESGRKRRQGRECDGRNGLREIWKEWDENGEQQW